MAEFAETNALVAALEKNETEGMEILHDFYPSELENLKDACILLMQWCQKAEKTAERRAQARDLVDLRNELRG